VTTRSPPPSRPVDAGALRLQAERALAETATASEADQHGTGSLVHELRVHQVELELQNDELRQAYDALQKSRDRYRDLYDHAPVGYMVVDPGTVIREANLTAARLLGVDRFELLSRPLASLLDREDADRLHVHLQKTLSSKGVETCELRQRRGDGTVVDLHIESVVADRRAGRLSACRSTLTDVTARNLADRRLRELTNGLERLVERRTAELVAANTALAKEMEEHQRSETALAAAQKMEALGRLAGGVAHDFNNLLTVVQLEVAMLRLRAASDSVVLGHVESIAEVVERAAALTGQLRAFGRRDVSSAERVNVAAAIRAVTPLLRRLVGDHIHVQVEADRDVGWVMLDRSHFEQILLNLAANARDAMTAGGTLSITASAGVDEATDGGRSVTITVRDDGSGMSRETQEHLFEPFFTTRQTDGGTGLGLATVYGIVNRAGGTIAVNSTLGEGSEFLVSLACVEPPPPADPRPLPGRAQGAGETVLLVEDRTDVRRIARAALRGAGYQILEASSGEEALEVAAHRGDDIAVVLSDVVMPGISGRELRERLGALAPSLAVVLMSGYLEDDVRDGGRYLQKPFALETLLHTLRDAIEDTRRARGGAPTSARTS